MEWRDEGIILQTRPYGDTQAIITLLTKNHGKHGGMLRLSKKKFGNAFLPGTHVTAAWQARLSEHLGLYRLETLSVPAASFLHDHKRFCTLTALTALLSDALADHDPHPEVYQRAEKLLSALRSEYYIQEYMLFERALLCDLGFGLDLSKCAATGRTENLRYISPVSGRAVSEEAGLPYKDKLLPLPAFWLNVPQELLPVKDILLGLEITGFFLEKHLFLPHRKTLPHARKNLMQQLEKISD